MIPKRLRTVRDPDDRRSSLRDVCEAGPRVDRRGRTGRARLRRCLRPRRATSSARVAQHGQLNAPWGLALAPAVVRPLRRRPAGRQLRRRGDQRLRSSWPNGRFEHRGTLRLDHGTELSIDGLWALEFGNAGVNGDPQHPVLHRRPQRRGRRALRHDHADELTTGSGGAAYRSPRRPVVRSAPSAAAERNAGRGLQPVPAQAPSRPASCWSSGRASSASSRRAAIRCVAAPPPGMLRCAQAKESLEVDLEARSRAGARAPAGGRRRARVVPPRRRLPARNRPGARTGTRRLLLDQRFRPRRPP